ncbi:BspA family leucine-rich repeat surface protein [Xylocopilactobacillus apis]|uniref:Surface protein n=1 Tax=Xylocopilactobacillus apis TaxID=2932183 RepID=A0AAU9DMA4_9LACO|nr:BspA family leucine-rich repeat surface protein [Xylocopilactobacillus apis]BDR56003.1 hypothetical protein KIMC2_05650 [Xylocopilactobacillus apis]
MNFNSENGRRRFNIILFWQVLILVALILTFLGKQFLAFNSKAEDTLSITKLSQVSTDLNQPLAGKDAFSLALAENSKVTASSNAVKLNRNTYQFNAVNNEISGEVTYSNAGITASGKLIDAVLTVTAQNASKVTVAPIGSITLTGRNAKAQMKLQFLLHGTKTPIAIDGHFTIDQLKPNEEIGLKLNQLKQIYSRGDSLVQTNSDQSYTNFKVNTVSEHNRFTAVYENQAELDYTLQNIGAEAGQLNLSSSSVVEIEMPQARMTGIDETVDPAESSEETKTDQFQGKLTETKAAPNKVRPLYLLQQNIPSKSAGYLGWNQIDDELDPVWSVEPKDIVITNELQEDVTNNFQVMIKGHHLTIDAAAEALKSSDFYGHTYSVLIKGKVNPQQGLQSDKDDLKLGKPNTAKITLKTADGVVTQKTNAAVNQVKVALPKVELDQSSIYSGMKTFSGKISHPETTKFYLSYKDNAGKPHDNEPLKITTKPNLTANALTARSGDTKEKWQAAMPENLNAKAAPVKLTAKSVDGMKKDFWLRDGTWWDYDYSSRTLTIHPHELNWDTDKVTYRDENNQLVTGWPWESYNGRRGSYINKVVLEPGVTAKGSLYRLFNFADNYRGVEIVGLAQLDTSQVTDMNSMFSGRFSSLDVSHFDTSNVTDMSGMFSGCYALTSLDLTHFDTSNVTDMSQMFKGSGLTSLDLSHFDTSQVTDMSEMFSGCLIPILNVTPLVTSNVTNMRGMFDQCRQVKSLDVTHFDTRKVTDMSGMFSYCKALTSLDVTHFDTSQVIDMGFMFANCMSLPSLDVTHFDTSKVTTMGSMFYGCSSLPALDVTHFDTSQVTDMSQMFYGCALPTIDVTHFDTSKVTTMGSMFYGCALLTIDVTHFDTSQVTDMSQMFAGCSKLTQLDLNNWDTSQVINMSAMFYNCNKLASIDFDRWNTSHVTNMTSMFLSCPILTSIDVSNWDTSHVTKMGSMFQGCVALPTVDTSRWDTSQVTQMAYMFYNCKLLNNLNTSNWNTGSVQTMNNMFEGCEILPTIDTSNWNTSSVTNMFRMFYGCTALNHLDVSSWDTGNVTDMSYLFYGCGNLPELAVTNWNLSKVQTLQYSFYGCGKLATLDVSHWGASQVTNMSYTFCSCIALTDLNFTNFDVSHVTDMSYAFYNCIGLTNLNVSNFQTNSLQNMKWIFYGCRSIPSLDVSNWYTGRVTDMNGVFSGCNSLTNLDVTKWITGMVKDMGSMFRGCSSLTSLDVTKLNTANVIKMDSMFSYCSSLTDLDVSHLNTTTTKTFAYMFQNCSSLQKLDLSAWDTSSLGQYYDTYGRGTIVSMFQNCTSLTSLNLNNFDTSKLGPSIYPGSFTMDHLFDNTPKLWKLTLGPKTKIYPKAKSGWQTFDPYFVNPTPGSQIVDLADPTGEYYCKDAKWQELGTSTNDHEPNGAVKTADDIIADSQLPHTDTRTYVWYQVGKLGFTAPTEIDLGTRKPPVNHEKYESEPQSIDVTDSRNLRTNKQWQVTVEATDLVKSDDSTKKIDGNPLYIKDSAGEHQITSTAAELYSGTSTGVGYQDEWNKPWNLVFKSSPMAIPATGTYKGTVTFTLVETTP